jgi:hypothetical protein
VPEAAATLYGVAIWCKEYLNVAFVQLKQQHLFFFGSTFANAGTTHQQVAQVVIFI